MHAQFCTCSKNLTDKSDDQATKLKIPAGLCCMQGCANCVWLDYAEALVQEYAEKGNDLDIEIIMNEIDKDITDPYMRQFIKIEIKSKFL